jgi:hypothetical protein
MSLLFCIRLYESSDFEFAHGLADKRVVPLDIIVLLYVNI